MKARRPAQGLARGTRPPIRPSLMPLAHFQRTAADRRGGWRHKPGPTARARCQSSVKLLLLFRWARRLERAWAACIMVECMRNARSARGGVPKLVLYLEDTTTTSGGGGGSSAYCAGLWRRSEGLYCGAWRGVVRMPGWGRGAAAEGMRRSRCERERERGVGYRSWLMAVAMSAVAGALMSQR